MICQSMQLLCTLIESVAMYRYVSCLYVYRLSVVVPVVAETEAGLSADDIQTTLSRHVDASLCVHWSLVFFH